MTPIGVILEYLHHQLLVFIIISHCVSVGEHTIPGCEPSTLPLLALALIEEFRAWVLVGRRVGQGEEDVGMLIRLHFQVEVAIVLTEIALLLLGSDRDLTVLLSRWVQELTDKSLVIRCHHLVQAKLKEANEVLRFEVVDLLSVIDVVHFDHELVVLFEEELLLDRLDILRVEVVIDALSLPNFDLHPVVVVSDVLIEYGHCI